MNPEKALEILTDLKPMIIEAGIKYVEPRYSGSGYRIDFVANPDDPKNYVTATDKHMSDVILPYCREKLPGSYSEEDLEKRGFRGPILLLDPVDDTLGFVHKTHETTGTLLGLLDENNLPIGGFAYAPETRTSSLSVKGYYDELLVDEIKQHVKESAGHIVAVQRMDAPNPKLDNFLEWLGRKLNIEVETIEGGGPGAFAAVNGKYDHNFFACTVGDGNWKEWDAAALEAILKERGWYVTDLRGNHITYNNFDPKLYQGFLATRLSHLDLTNEDVAEYLAEFTERYGSIMVSPDVYKEWASSSRAKEWAEVVDTVPVGERSKLLKRNVLVE